jgi:CRISPR-associated protein Csm1
LGERPTFASWAALSRRVGDFFSIAVPHLCAREPEFQDIYTVFAGGDDFFFIGPWKQMKRFAAALRREFGRYVCDNPAIHFSAGYTMAKPGHPLKALTDSVEDSLERAKARPGKNAICISDRSEGHAMPWRDFEILLDRSRSIGDLVARYRLSTGYLYTLLECSRLAGEQERGCVTAARWRSLLAYRTCRMIEDASRRKNSPFDEGAQVTLMRSFVEDGIGAFKGNYALALSDHIYGERD